MRVTADLAARSHTYLKKVPFCLAMLALGLETNPVRARLIGINARTIDNALDGNPISGQFIGNTITALRPFAEQLARVGLTVDLDTFFEVREQDTDVAA